MFRNIKWVNNVRTILNIYNLGEKEKEVEWSVESLHNWYAFCFLLSLRSSSVFLDSLDTVPRRRSQFLLLCRFPSKILLRFIPFGFRLERLFIGKYEIFHLLFEFHWFDWGVKASKPMLDGINLLGSTSNNRIKILQNIGCLDRVSRLLSSNPSSNFVPNGFEWEHCWTEI